MDLPEKLQQKIASRIGNNRLVYEPYNRQQIAQILQCRLNGTKGIFEDAAIKLLAMKVSSYSGDIRRSLQVAKRALEITRDQYEEKYRGDYTKPLIPVTYDQVSKAFADLYNTKTCHLLKSLRKFEVLVVLAIYLEQLTKKSEKIPLNAVQDRCDTMLKNLNYPGITNISSNMFKEIVKRLQSFGILNVIIENSKITDNIFLQLFLYHDEITSTYEEHEIYKTFEMVIKVHTNAGEAQD